MWGKIVSNLSSFVNKHFSKKPKATPPNGSDYIIKLNDLNEKIKERQTNIQLKQTNFRAVMEKLVRWGGGLSIVLSIQALGGSLLWIVRLDTLFGLYMVLIFVLYCTFKSHRKDVEMIEEQLDRLYSQKYELLIQAMETLDSSVWQSIFHLYDGSAFFHMTHYTSNPVSYCPICQEALDGGIRMCALSCGHVYHGECISAWFRHGSTCPLCGHAARAFTVTKHTSPGQEVNSLHLQIHFASRQPADELQPEVSTTRMHPALCTLCQEQLVAKSELGMLFCGHVFHQDCLVDWLVHGHSHCPVCITEMQRDNFLRAVIRAVGLPSVMHFLAKDSFLRLYFG